MSSIRLQSAKAKATAKGKSNQAHFPLQLIRAAVAAFVDDDYVAHVKKLGILLGTFIALRTSDEDRAMDRGSEREEGKGKRGEDVVGVTCVACYEISESLER